MDINSSGAGLAALGFWMFIAVAVAAGVWDSIRRREAEHETLRRIIESGQDLDNEMIQKVLALTGENPHLAKDMKITGIILFGVAPGLAILGWVLSLIASYKILLVMLGVAGLVLCIGLGMFAAASYAERTEDDEVSSVR